MGRYRDRFEMYAAENRREDRVLIFRVVVMLIMIVVACVMGFMSCRAKMDACEKAGISFWLCFDNSTRLVVPLDDGADHSHDAEDAH